MQSVLGWLREIGALTPTLGRLGFKYDSVDERLLALLERKKASSNMDG